MDTRFSAAHRGGAGPPMVCLHGFLDTWRTWELILPTLERRRDVLAPALAGHAGGPPLPAAGALHAGALADAVERAMDAAGFAAADIVGNSLGGYVALQLAARRRARTVVALAPAGGWAAGDESWRETLSLQAELQGATRAAAPQADAIAATPAGRRAATALIVTDPEHMSAELVAHQIRGVAGADGAATLIDHAQREGWPLDAERITCPVRVIWGTADRLLAWPSAALRYRHDWLPWADWVEMEGVGHCPQLDAPLATAHLVLGFSDGR